MVTPVKNQPSSTGGRPMVATSCDNDESSRCFCLSYLMTLLSVGPQNEDRSPPTLNPAPPLPSSSSLLLPSAVFANLICPTAAERKIERRQQHDLCAPVKRLKVSQPMSSGRCKTQRWLSPLHQPTLDMSSPTMPVHVPLVPGTP